MTPEIILGPPGTGKTTTLLGIVDDELAAGVAPNRIGYVSFTKRAAQEAIDRACARFSLTRQQLRYFRTLHSMCFQELGMSNSDVLEGKKLMEFGDWLGVEFSEMRMSDDGTLTGFTPGDRALFLENLARVRCVPLRQQYNEMNADGVPWQLVERVSRGLADYKANQHLKDYTDMLQDFAATEYSPDLEVLLVDEAQDLSLLQWRVVEKLARSVRRVVLAGDDDQSIYRWAGAAVDHFIDMRGGVRVLGQSWRCPPQVQALSSEIIGRVRHRRPKEWMPRDAEGLITRVKNFAQVDLSGPDNLILGRNAFVLRDVMPGIRADGIIFDYKGHSSVSQLLLQAVRTWEALRAGQSVTADEVRRVYEYMTSGVGVKRGYKALPGIPPGQMVDLQWLTLQGGLMREDIWHEALDRVAPLERTYLLRARQKGETTTGRPRVRLSTIHGAKGGEAEHVVLMRDMATRTYNEMRESPEDEARVWYVAVTRAKTRLTIVAPQSHLGYDL